MPSKYFAAAPYDRRTRIKTWVFCVVEVALTLTPHGAQWLAVFFLPVLLISWAGSVRGYVVEDGAVVVKRRFRRRLRVELEDKIQARIATTKDLGVLRFHRVAPGLGLFGYKGSHSYRLDDGLGSVLWCATDSARVVLLKIRMETTLLSPDDPEGFLAAVRDHAGAAGVPAESGLWGLPTPVILYIAFILTGILGYIVAAGVSK